MGHWGTPFLHELLSHIFAFCKSSSSQRLMCLGDVWQWLSGTFEAHPISRFRFSFLVIYGTFDEFSLSADMFRNCQSFDWNGISEKKKSEIEKKKCFHRIIFFCAQNCLAWGSQPHHLATQRLADLADWPPHSLFTVLCLVYWAWCFACLGLF